MQPSHVSTPSRYTPQLQFAAASWTLKAKKDIPLAEAGLMETTLKGIYPDAEFSKSAVAKLNELNHQGESALDETQIETTFYTQGEEVTLSVPNESESIQLQFTGLVFPGILSPLFESLSLEELARYLSKHLNITYLRKS